MNSITETVGFGDRIPLRETPQEEPKSTTPVVSLKERVASPAVESPPESVAAPYKPVNSEITKHPEWPTLKPNQQKEFDEMYSSLTPSQRSFFNDKIKAGDKTNLDYWKYNATIPDDNLSFKTRDFAKEKGQVMTKTRLNSALYDLREFVNQYGPLKAKKKESMAMDKGSNIHETIQNLANRQYDRDEVAKLAETIPEIKNYLKISEAFDVLGSEVSLGVNVPTQEVYGPETKETGTVPFGGDIDLIVKFKNDLNFNDKNLNDLLRNKTAVVEIKTASAITRPDQEMSKTLDKAYTAMSDLVFYKYLIERAGNKQYKGIRDESGQRPILNFPSEDVAYVVINPSTGYVTAVTSEKLKQLEKEALIPTIRSLLNNLKEGPSKLLNMPVPMRQRYRP